MILRYILKSKLNVKIVVNKKSGKPDRKFTKSNTVWFDGGGAPLGA